MSDRITDLSSYDIRYTQESDKDDVKKWLLDPSNLRWFPMEEEKEVDLMATNWVGFSKYKSSLTAVFEGNPVGIITLFLMPYQKIAHLAIIYLVIDPNMVGKGIATSLIKNIKNLAKNYFRLRSIHFELMVDSPLIPILIEQGFKEIIRQENFFKREGNSIARVVMEVVL